MKITEKIEKDLIQAMKARKEVELSVLRMMRSAMKYAEIAKRPDLFEDQDVIKVLRSEIKKRQEAIVEYQKGNRSDLVSKDTADIAVIKRYLPPELSDEELKKIIQKVIDASGAISQKDFGRVMGAAMKEIGQKADGTRVGQLVKEAMPKFGSE